MRWRKGQDLYSVGQTVSMQLESSAMTKSARVRYPMAKSFSPTNLLSWSSLTLYFSRMGPLAVSWSLLKNSPLTAELTSVKTERMLSIWALSWAVFPRSSVFPHLLTMYLWMAVDSVTLYSPSTKQGRLGKSRPRWSLSSPNHLSLLVQWQSSNSTPEQARSSLGVWAKPLMPQQASLTLERVGWRAAKGGTKGRTMASGREQQALTPGRASTLCLILHQNGQVFFSLGKRASKQQRFSAKTKSTRVRQPRANSLSPTKFLINSNLERAFSSCSILMVSQSLFQKRARMSLRASLKTPMRLSTLPWSWTVLPSNSLLPDFLMTYLAMAADSVSLKSPSMRQGRLGKSKPIAPLSSLNHLSWLSYCTSSNSTPVQERSRRMYCAKPLIFQQPRTTLLIRYVYDGSRLILLLDRPHQKIKISGGRVRGEGLDAAIIDECWPIDGLNCLWRQVEEEAEMWDDLWIDLEHQANAK